MYKFVFVAHLSANGENNNFKGEKRAYAYGKGTSWEVKDDQDLEWFAKTYGYNRKCDAVRNMNWHKNNLHEKYWDKEYKLVEVNIWLNM